MNNLNKELELKKDSIERFVDILKFVAYQKKKQKEVYKIIDYLEEQVYLRDISLDEDQYKLFFEEVYDLLNRKDLISFYHKILSDYINNCLIDNECLQDRGNLNTFLRKLNDFVKVVEEYHGQLQTSEIVELKEKVKKRNDAILTPKAL